MPYYITHFKTNTQQHYTSSRQSRPNNLHNISHNTAAFAALQVQMENENLDRSWRTFQIPKASGGMRTITAPSEDLKNMQQTLVHLLRDDYKILESNWSYAYFRGRCTTDANKAHIENRSAWFLKVDIKDFFPSITPTVIKETIDTVYPTCTFPAIARRELCNVIEYFALLEGKAPQGSVSSPFISNWVMVPYLYQIHKKINSLAVDPAFPQIPKQKYILTCYADDITISAKNQFNWRQMQDAIAEILAPHFNLKQEKTKYTWNRGRNHMLGKVLNAENNISMGYRKLREWKHTLLSLCNEINGSVPERSIHERQTIFGKLNWDFNTQRDYLTHLIDKYETKFLEGRSIIQYLKGN